METIYIWTTLIKLIALGIITMVYVLCGRGWKWGNWRVKRRVVIPALLCVAWVSSVMLLKVASIQVLMAIALSWVIYYLAMSVGYGSDGTKLNALFRRFVYGFLVGCSPILIAYISHSWALYFYGVGVSVMSSVVLGVWNNIVDNAVVEESLIAIGTFTIPLFLI